MSAKDDGGPAYPGQEKDSWDGFSEHEGMSLRDHFAGLAMSGMLMGILGRFNDGSISAYKSGPCNQSIADRAYVMADAMLAERAKQ
jgi:hypothetical protein